MAVTVQRKPSKTRRIEVAFVMSPGGEFAFTLKSLALGLDFQQRVLRHILRQMIQFPHIEFCHITARMQIAHQSTQNKLLTS